MPPSGISQKLKKHLGFFRGVFYICSKLKWRKHGSNSQLQFYTYFIDYFNHGVLCFGKHMYRCHV